MARAARVQEGVQGNLSVSPEGLKRISETIRDLPEKVAGRRVLVGMKRALRKTRDKARTYVDPWSGALNKSIHVVNGKRSTEGNPYVVIRVNPSTEVAYQSLTGDIVNHRPKSYLHWIVDGVNKGPRTSERGFVVYDADRGSPMRIRKINHPGIEGRDIFGDALKATQGRVLSEMFSEIQRSVDQYRKKNGIAK